MLFRSALPNPQALDPHEAHPRVGFRSRAALIQTLLLPSSRGAAAPTLAPQPAPPDAQRRESPKLNSANLGTSEVPLGGGWTAVWSFMRPPKGAGGGKGVADPFSEASVSQG